VILRFLAIPLATLFMTVSAGAQPAPEQSAASAPVPDPVLVETTRRADIAEQKARAAEADQKARKAALGSLGDFTTDGKVSVASDAGKFEAEMLADEALAEGADAIARRLCLVVLDANCGSTTIGKAKPVVVYTDTTAPTHTVYEVFSVQAQTAQTRFKRALAMTDVSPTPQAGGGVSPSGGGLPIAAIATGVDLLGKLLRTEYAAAGVALTPDQILLVKELAGRARGLGHKSDFYLPGLYSGLGLLGPDNPVVADLGQLDDFRAAAMATMSSKPGPEKSTALRDAVTRYDALLEGLATVGPDGQAPALVMAAKEALPAELLRQGALLMMVRTDRAGGTTYTKRNFLTAFGPMPFFVSGGAIVSYALFDGPSGRMVDGYSLRRMTPFQSVSRVGRIPIERNGKGPAR